MGLDRTQSDGVTPSLELLSMQAIAEQLAQYQNAYIEMTKDFNAFAREHTGLECVQAIVEGHFRVACQDFSGVEVLAAREGEVDATYQPHWFQNNSFGTTQGGSLAVPLDGIITLAGRTLVGQNQTAVTKGLNVSYKRPVSAEKSGLLKVFGHAERDGQEIFSHGWLQDESGAKVVVAQAEILVRDIP